MDRVTGVATLSRHEKEFSQRHTVRDRYDVGTWNHDLACPYLLQLEDRLQHVLLVSIQDAPEGGLLDDDPQFLLGVGFLGLGGGGTRIRAKAGSPIHPSPNEEIVMPSWHTER
jgi:hypothetical protein